jgi:uncharacterized repeat protein (TIGR01451 family)
MKICLRHFLLLPALIAGISLLSAGRVVAQNFSVLHNFNPTPGSDTPVVAGPDGALYGTTTGGGSIGFGTIFKVNPDGTGFTNLYSFTGGADGGGIGEQVYGVSGALVVSGNTLYGTLPGSFGNHIALFGTLFKINLDGTGFATLFTFTNADNGTSPGPLVLSGGTLYGATVAGNTNNVGTLFRINTNGTGFATFYTFPNTSDGYIPDALAVSGNTLYGTTEGGGTYGSGNIFSVGTDGNNFTNIYSYNTPVYAGGLSYTNSDGYSPSSLLLSGNRLYVTASVGGPGGAGTVIAVNTDGSSFTNLYNFTSPGSSNGFDPVGLILSGNTLYGTTLGGGISNAGTVFGMKTDGSGFASLHRFNPLVAGTNSDGNEPLAGLLLLNGTLYGTAFLGGSSGAGDIFAVNTNGTGFANLYNFPSGGDGLGPVGLMLSGNTLYGATSSGGNGNAGTVFQINTDGTGYASIYKFTPFPASTNSDGATPNSVPILSGNMLYLVTQQGGSNALGTLVKLNTNGTGIVTLHNFTGGNDGQLPDDLILSGSTLYGVAVGGGRAARGTLFAVNTSGAGFTNFYAFPTTTSGTNSAGAFPKGMILSGGTLYGTALTGGTNGAGTVFKVNPDGTGFAVLHTFSAASGDITNADGENPEGDIVQMGATLYGITSNGGTNEYGTIFEVNTDGTGFAVVYTFPATIYGYPVCLVSDGTRLYGTTSTILEGAGYGIVFAINSDGTGFTNLYSFTDSFDGSLPVNLVVSGNTIYGVTTSEQGNGSESGTLFALTPPVTGADLNLSASTGTGTITLGSGEAYSLTVSNAGPSAASGVVISNRIPANETFYSVTGGATPANGVLLVNLGSLAAGAATNITLIVFPTLSPSVASGQLTNQFQVFASTTDPVLTNNSATVVSTVTNATVGSPPTVTITFPTPGEVVTNQLLEVTGTVTRFSTSVAVSNVLFGSSSELDNGGWRSVQTTINWTNWTADVTLTPGSNTVSVYLVDTNGNFSATNSVTFDYQVTAGALFAAPPGTPASGFANAGGAIEVIPIGGGIGVQPITNNSEQFFPNATAFAGDVVFLINTNNGTNPTNWAAVLRFVNPADPTGTNGLFATEYETYFPTNAGPNYFAGFSLLPNVDYAAITGTNSDGSITAQATVFGPLPSVLSGQEAIIVYTASIQPSAGADLSLTASTGTGAVTLGSAEAYYLTVSNAGPSAASGVVISNQLPANETFYSVTGGATPANGVLLVNLGTLAAGAATNLTLTVYPTLPAGVANGQLTNQFQVFASTPDPVLTNNSATVVSSLYDPIPGTPITGSVSLYDRRSFVVLNGTVFGSGPLYEINPNTNTNLSFIAYTATPGDFILLNDPAGGSNPTNWVAVVRSFNPADPTGTNGLGATYSQAFFATNFGGAGFAGLQLFPNTNYVAVGPLATPTNFPTYITFFVTQFGPAGAILAGQEAQTIWTVTGPYTDLSLSASAAPQSVTVGSNLVYTITVSNAPNIYYPSNTVTATGVVVSNRIPANCTFVSATGGASPVNGVLLVNLGSLAEGTNVSVQVVVQPTAAGSLTNSFQVFANEFDPNLTNNSATVVSTVTNAAVVSYDFPGTPIAWTNPGGQIVVFFTYGFAGNPVPIQVGSGSNPASTCQAGDLVALINSNGGNDPANWAAVVRFFNPADPTGTLGLAATYEQTFFATNYGGSGFNGYQLFPAVSYIPGITNAPGFTSALAFSYTELGPAGGITPGQEGIDVVTLFPLTSGVNIASPTNGQVVSSAVLTVTGMTTNYAYNGGTLTNLEVTNVLVQLNGGSWTNATTLNGWTNWSANLTLTPGSNTVSAYAVNGYGSFSPTSSVTLDYSTGGSPQADLSLSASAAPEPVGVNSNLVYSIVITNQGPNVASGVTVSNRIPAGVNFVSATGGATPTNGVLLVNLGSLTNGAVTNVQVIVQLTAAGKLTNFFQIFADQTDPVLTNNFASVISTVTNTPVVAGFPGTPYNTGNWTFTNSAGSGGTDATILFSALVGISAQPFQINFSDDGVGSIRLVHITPPTNAIAGDIVMLRNPSGGNNPTNWLAVARFVNPNDPTGINGLAATKEQGFFPGNLGVNGFAGFTLLPNAYFLAGTTNADGSQVSVVDTEIGMPTAGLQAGEVGIFTTTVSNSVADLSMTASAAPEPVGVGSNLVYSLTFSNAGPSVASGVTVSNRIPVGVTFVSATGGATPTNGVLLVNLGSLTNGAVTNVQVIVQPTAAGKLTNFFHIFADQTDPVLTNNFASVISTVTNTPVVAGFPGTPYNTGNWTFTNSAGSGGTDATILFSALVGISAQPFQINFSDDGVGSIRLVHITPPTNAIAGDIVMLRNPSGGNNPTNWLAVARFVNPNDPTGINGLAATKEQGFFPGNLGVNGFAGFTLLPNAYFLAGTTNADGSQVSVVDTEIGMPTAGLQAGEVGIFTTTVSNSVADLSMTASAAPEPVGVGSNLVYSLTFSNAGPSVASGVTVSNRIPVGVTFVSATGGATPTNGVLLVNLGSLTNGAVTNVQVIVQLTAAGKLTNFFQIFADQTDPVLTNNFAAVISTVTNVTVVPPPVDVALSLAAAPNPVSVGAPLTYSLTVTNNSSTPATGVVVSNTLPPNVTVFSLLPSQGAATNQAGVVTYNLGSLPNGSAATLAIVVIPNAAGLLTNTASVSSLQTDSQPANNLATNITSAVNAPITNLVLTVLSAITLNPQTGLFEQLIEVSNGGPATPSSVLVLISGLAANVKVYNATGTTNGVPYVQSSSPLGIGSNVVFLLEYYVPTRIAPTNLTLTVQAGPIVIPPVVSGTILNISRMIKLDNGSVLVEFSAVPGQVYAIQYSSDMVTWLTAVPAITAPANQVQWIDSGPPKTVSSPAQQGARYYRVVLLTAH